MRLLRLIIKERPIRDNESAAAGSEGAIRMLPQVINPNFQSFREEPVVGIEKNQVFASALLPSFVTSG